MSMQRVLQPMLTAMRLAQALRHLRDLELQDARRYRELRDAGGAAREFLDRRLRHAVDHARTCNHRLVQVQRKIRRTIEASHFLNSSEIRQLAPRVLVRQQVQPWRRS